MLSTCLRGQTGPERAFGGFGSQGAAIAGIHGLTGWPDRPPVGPWGAYTDFIAPRYGVSTLGSALLHRWRTGEGQYIDFSQVEAAIHFIEPLLLDYEASGRVPPASGLDSDRACPHGVYRTAGAERFIAIATETAEQWHALLDAAPINAAPLSAFARPELDDLAARLAVREAIDKALSAWCATEQAFPLAERLRAAGVPASAVQRSTDLYEDPQLAERGFFVTLDHAVMGPTPYDGPVTIFSETPGIPRTAAPALGQHTDHILRELLGLGDDEIAQAAMAGALA
jgi:benzylsuccinate CoA-transferase BbsF subunit